MLSIGDILQIQRHKQSENKKMEKDISCKQQPQKKAGVGILQYQFIDMESNYAAI